MSKLLLFAIRDTAVGAFMAPLAARSIAEASRIFSDAVNDPAGSIGKHAADYELYAVGSWDDKDGILECATPLRLILKASECLPVVESK